MKLTSIITLLAITLLIGCSKYKYDTGIKGLVESGQGDCMPIIDYSSRTYDKFRGEIYFIVKEDLDSLGNGSFNDLKNNSISVSIKFGKLSEEIPAGTYMIFPADDEYRSETNPIIIKSGEVLNMDIKLWDCTSY